MTVDEFISIYGDVEVKFASYYGNVFYFEGRVDGMRLVAKVNNKKGLEVDTYPVTLKDAPRPYECEVLDSAFQPVVRTKYEIL